MKKTTKQDLSDLVVSVCRRVWIARRENDKTKYNLSDLVVSVCRRVWIAR